MVMGADIVLVGVIFAILILTFIGVAAWELTFGPDEGPDSPRYQHPDFYPDERNPEFNDG